MTTKAPIVDVKKPLSQRILEFMRASDDKFTLEKALLFGSTATAKRRRESDIDIVIVSKAFNDIPAIDRMNRLFKLWPYMEELHIIAYAPEEFKEAKHRPLVKEILSYAIDITPKKMPPNPSPA